MIKWYQRSNKEEGNRWMLLGSKAARVLSPEGHGFEPGQRVQMNRHEYEVQSDGSVKRISGKPRKRKRPGIIFSAQELDVTR